MPVRLYNGQYPLAPVTAATAATTSSTMPQPLVNPRTPLPMSAPRATTPRTARSALPTVFCIFCPFRVKLFHRRTPRPNGYMVPGCTPATYHRSTRDPDWGRVQMPRLLAAIAHPRVQTHVSPSVASPSLAAPWHATKHRAFCALAPPTAKDTRSRRCSFSVGCWSQLGRSSPQPVSIYAQLAP